VSGFALGGPLGGDAPDRAQAAQVRRWTREAFGLGADQMILVSELRCHEPGCPPVETVITVVGAEAGERSEHRLHLAVSAISPAHIWQLAAGDHGCCR
jgi:hypothetical protein